MQLDIQQFQDQGTFVPLLPWHAAIRNKPPLDFHGRVLVVAALVPAHVPCHSRLDTAAALGIFRIAPHGYPANYLIPVPFDVRRTALHFPLRAFAPRVQVGLRQEHRHALGAPSPHSRLLCADPSRDNFLPFCIHSLCAPETFRQ